MLNKEYLIDLLQRSRNELIEEVRVKDIDFDDFELINFYLIYNALNQSTYSLSINFPNRDDKRDFYIPTLISVAATLFFQNYVDDKTVYEVGDIIQKDGRRYKITGEREGEYIIVGEDTEKTIKYPSKRGIRRYIVTTADLSKRQVKTKFDNYRNLFKLLFNEEYVPSKFSYKSAIIVERKDFLETLSEEKIPNIELKKAIPFKWVTKKGVNKDESEYIPIEPMIYLLPDYETFKDFVLDDVDRLDSVVFIGRNKYAPFLTQIRKDLRNKTIQKAIFIGSTEIEKFHNLRTWKWTHEEINFFENGSENFGTISFSTSNPQEFLQSVKKFETRIEELEEEFCLNLRTIQRLKKYLHSLVIPSFKSRLTCQKYYLLHLYKREINSVLTELFLEINIDPKQYIQELSNYIDEIISTIPLSKYDLLCESSTVDILIVPERFVNIWNEEKHDELSKRYGKKLKIITFSEFKEKHNYHRANKQVYFLTLFGFKDSHIDIFKFIIQSQHDFNFILYPEEKLIAENLFIKANNELIREYRSEDRLFLCGIDFPSVEKEETVNEMMKRIYGQDKEKSQKAYVAESNEQIEYEITYNNNETIVLEGSKKVLLEHEGVKRNETVANLIIGDCIRVYENTAKERLFDIAVESDDAGIFTEIIKYSKLWKRCLINYYNEKRSATYSELEMLSELQKNGAKIQSAALKKWLNIDDQVLFPSEIINLIAIKETTKCQILNENFGIVKHNRRLYRGIMIALGRDMSDEITDYIISEKRVVGNILSRFTTSQIDSMIDANAPLRTIKKIKIIESTDNE